MFALLDSFVMAKGRRALFFPPYFFQPAFRICNWSQRSAWRKQREALAGMPKLGDAGGRAAVAASWPSFYGGPLRSDGLAPPSFSLVMVFMVHKGKGAGSKTFAK